MGDIFSRSQAGTWEQDADKIEGNYINKISRMFSCLTNDIFTYDN